ncbi:P-loop ATPase, Sll1717 family [Altererythrobacter sp. C41]|uniref:P-loop ATPase, Sll1717 family n=1 Tax=Altererythrobacter sp. C41 TaxID=2806021 RepID=UPI0019312FC1|nr:hypothetical protein [Altererythrobacter sp. C41]MBM0170880.1 hypothetical protein [Altererythrobacter sp. C41]
MTVEVAKIEFGEIDAKNEVIQQDRLGSSVFHNSFRIPPEVNPDALITGAKCFIYGQKGCGKTALLLHVRKRFEDSGARTKTILFKSSVTERERQKIALGGDIVFEDQGEIKFREYDYKINWLWYIYRNIFRLVEKSMVLSGWSTVEGIKALLGVKQEISTSVLTDLSSKRIKAFAKAGVKSGPFTAEMGAEVEALKDDIENSDIEIIDIVERYLPEIKLNIKDRVALLFDELELFWNRIDQKERDLFLIRDLLYAVNRANVAFGQSSASFSVIASVRSEVLHEVNREGPEISRDVQDRGIRVHWNVKADAIAQPILEIVENKIKFSEIELDELPTENIWASYFPAKIFGRTIQQYLLDISMFKPRNLVTLLGIAKKKEAGATSLSKEAIEQSQPEFSQRCWTEIEEGLLGEFTSNEVRAIKVLFMGFRPKFSPRVFETRFQAMAAQDARVKDLMQKHPNSLDILDVMYRLGAIGNVFSVREGKRWVPRNRWMFRDHYEAIPGKEFQVHESLKKELQLPFV